MQRFRDGTLNLAHDPDRLKIQSAVISAKVNVVNIGGDYEIAHSVRLSVYMMTHNAPYLHNGAR